jgi:hypothetical protein
LFKQLRRQQIAKQKIIWHFSPNKK